MVASINQNFVFPTKQNMRKSKKNSKILEIIAIFHTKLLHKTIKFPAKKYRTALID